MYKKIVVKNLGNSFLRLSVKGAKFDDTALLLLEQPNAPNVYLVT
jgi:hypothetical protein